LLRKSRKKLPAILPNSAGMIPVGVAAEKSGKNAITLKRDKHYLIIIFFCYIFVY
jgi:hypothetical protein